MRGAVNVTFDGAMTVALAERCERAGVPAEQLVRDATRLVLALSPERLRIALAVLDGKPDADIAATENLTNDTVARFRRSFGMMPNRRLFR